MLKTFLYIYIYIHMYSGIYGSLLWDNLKYRRIKKLKAYNVIIEMKNVKACLNKEGDIVILFSITQLSLNILIFLGGELKVWR